MLTNALLLIVSLMLFFMIFGLFGSIEKQIIAIRNRKLVENLKENGFLCSTFKDNDL